MNKQIEVVRCPDDNATMRGTHSHWDSIPSGGPWMLRRTAVYWTIEGAGGEHIAFLGIDYPPRAKANANLLLAAPDMLAALDAVLAGKENAVELAEKARSKARKGD